MWLIDSMAGSWVFILLRNVGDIHQWWIRGSVAGAGALVMAMAGWILCGLNVRKRIWIGLWAVGAVAWSGFMMSRFTSPAEALAKNRWWWTYIFSTTMMAFSFATLLGLMGGGVKLLARRFAKPLGSGSGSNPAAASQ
jgi:hypothetical protein